MLQSFYFLEGATRNTLQIAIHAYGRINHTCYLSFSLCPQPGHGLALPVEVRPHVGEFLHNGFDTMPESWPRKILVDKLHLRGLALALLGSAGSQDPRQ